MTSTSPTSWSRELGVPDQNVPRLAVHPGDRRERIRRLAGAVRDDRLVTGAVEHRPQVVRHPSINSDVCAHSGDLLHRPYAVSGDAGVPDQRASRLDQDPRGRVEDPPHPGDLHLDVVIDLGRFIGIQVCDAEPASDVEQLEPEVDGVAEVGDHLDRLHIGLELEDLGADVGVQPDELQVGGLAYPLDRLLGEPVGQPEAELGVELPGLDVVVGGGLDPRRDPDQHALRPLEQPLGALDLVERVEDQMPDARLEGVAEFRLGLVVAVQVDPRRIEAGGQGHAQLAPRGDVDREALLAHHAVRGGGGKRLARVDHLEGIGAFLEGAHVFPGPAADVVLGVDIGRGAEPVGKLHQVATRDLEMSAFVHARARRVDRRGGDRIRRRGRAGLGPVDAHGESNSDGNGDNARNGALSGTAPRSREQPSGARLRALAARGGAALARRGDRARRRLSQGEPRRFRGPRRGERLGGAGLRPAGPRSLRGGDVGGSRRRHNRNGPLSRRAGRSRSRPGCGSGLEPGWISRDQRRGLSGARDRRCDCDLSRRGGPSGERRPERAPRDARRRPTRPRGLAARPGRRRSGRKNRRTATAAHARRGRYTDPQ